MDRTPLRKQRIYQIRNVVTCVCVGKNEEARIKGQKKKYNVNRTAS